MKGKLMPKEKVYDLIREGKITFINMSDVQIFKVEKNAKD